MRKKIVIIMLVVFIAALGIQIYRKYPKSDQVNNRRQKDDVAVEMVQIEKNTIRDMGVFTGSLKPQSQFIVASKVSGRLKKLLVDVGDKIKKDSLIALLDDEEYVQQVNQARGELEVAIANLEESASALEIAKREYDRSKTMSEKKFISDSDFDAAEAKYNAQVGKNKVASAQVSQKEAALKTTQLKLSYTKITATWENENTTRIVGERFFDEGVMLSSNTPIVSILNISTLKGEIFVSEKDYFRLKEEQILTITSDAFPGKTFTGNVARISPQLDENSRQARVEIEVPNSENLLIPGMFVKFNIEFVRHDNANVIPVSAIVKRGEVEGVFLADLEEKKAKFVPLKIGIINNGFAEIIEPELTGSVITLGQHLLDDGSGIVWPGSGDKKEEKGN